MAGNWIKMRHDLATDPAVIAIAGRLGLDEDMVVGKLHRLWSWADQHTEDGNAVGVTLSWVERYVNVVGFGEMLVRVGWMSVHDDGVRIVNFDRHMGKSAKKRALVAERVKRLRNADGVTKALPEKRREDKKNTTPLPPSGFAEFWAAYPRKDNKVAALKSWRRLSPDDELRATLMAAVATQRGWRQWREGVIPHAATWLNNRRWEDEPESGGGETPPAADRPFVC